MEEDSNQQALIKKCAMEEQKQYTRGRMLVDMALLSNEHESSEIMEIKNSTSIIEENAYCAEAILPNTLHDHPYYTIRAHLASTTSVIQHSPDTIERIIDYAADRSTADLYLDKLPIVAVNIAHLASTDEVQDIYDSVSYSTSANQYSIVTIEEMIEYAADCSTATLSIDQLPTVAANITHMASTEVAHDLHDSVLYSTSPIRNSTATIEEMIDYATDCSTATRKIDQPKTAAVNIDPLASTEEIQDLHDSVSLSGFGEGTSSDEENDPYATSGSLDLDFIPNDVESSTSSGDSIIEDRETSSVSSAGNEIQNTRPENTNTRKRPRNVRNWRRNKIKKLHNSGMAYVNWKSEHVAAKNMKPPCSTTCRLKCQIKYSHQQRKKIFNEFWELGDINRQREFILRNLTVKPTARSRKRKTPATQAENSGDITNAETASRRKLSYFYKFPVPDSPLSHIKICQTFFLNTLNISNQMVKTVVQKTHKSDVLSAKEDRRGKAQCNSRLTYGFKKSVRQHINSFKVIESHYCRKNTNKKYLPSDLNIKKMHELYKIDCKEKQINTVASYAIYRDVFNKEFNLGFFIPKKDQCDLCNKWNNSSAIEKEALNCEMELHKKGKELSRASKERDKERATNDKTYCLAIYDLQKALLCPKAEVSQLYYRRKLSTYNLTVYDAGNKQGYCYMWPESMTSRGACEIGSCILSFISQMVEFGVKEFSFYSDNCAGRNRNRFIYCLYMYCAAKYGVKITHGFLEKGHTKNECDSVHGVIEKASKNIPIFSPQQWYTLARTACKVRPYKIKEMGQDDFVELKDLLLNTTKNWEKTDDGQRVKLNNFKVIMVDPGCPSYELNIKYSYDVEYIKINTLQLKRSNHNLVPFDDYVLKRLRNSAVPIALAKYKDLVFLCNQKVIPSEYHGYFMSLKFANKVGPGESESDDSES